MGAAFAMEFAAVTGLRSQRSRRPYVDFATVPVSQWTMHDRLQNWARWARGSDNQSGVAAQPMFSLYRSTEAKRAYGEETTVPVDKDDAIRVAKAVGHLPHGKRRAIHWYYLRGGKNPSAEAREAGLELHQLAQLVRDARQVLIGWVRS